MTLLREAYHILVTGVAVQLGSVLRSVPRRALVTLSGVTRGEVTLSASWTRTRLSCARLSGRGSGMLRLDGAEWVSEVLSAEHGWRRWEARASSAPATSIVPDLAPTTSSVSEEFTAFTPLASGRGCITPTARSTWYSCRGYLTTLVGSLSMRRSTASK